jgi:uncharacterized protein (TIGR02246 family)
MAHDDGSVKATQIVQTQLDAYNQRDLTAFLRCYAPDCRIEDGMGEILLDGRAAIAERYRSLFAQAPRLHAEITTRLAIGSFVVDQEHVTGLPAHDGGERDLDAIAIYHIEDGLIRRVRMLP